MVQKKDEKSNSKNKAKTKQGTGLRLKRWWKRHKPKLVIATLVSLFLLFAMWNRIVIPIYAGQLGVRWLRLQGGTELTRAYAEGLHLIYPWDRMHIYDVRVQEIHEEVQVLATNGLVISVRISARFYLDRQLLPFLHQKIGPEYIDKLVRPEVISAVRQVVGNFGPEEIYAKDEEGLLAQIFGVAHANLDPHYVHLQKLLIKELFLPDPIQEAIQDKLTQEQIMLSYKYRITSEEREMERRIIEAKGVQEFEQISGISILRWRGIQATEALAQSPNSKVVIIGNDADSLPVILNSER